MPFELVLSCRLTRAFMLSVSFPEAQMKIEKTERDFPLKYEMIVKPKWYNCHLHRSSVHRVHASSFSIPEAGNCLAVLVQLVVLVLSCASDFIPTCQWAPTPTFLFTLHGFKHSFKDGARAVKCILTAC